MPPPSSTGLLAVATLVALAGTAAAEPPCAPVARLSGPAELVDAVAPLLVERGVAIDGASDCGEVAAALEHDGERVRIAITDADGRSVERIAGDADDAATAIESWTRRDLGDPLLAARAAPSDHDPGLDLDSPPVSVDGVAAPAASPARRIEVAAGFDGGLSDDGALWRGLRAQGCVQVGALCAGAMVRYLTDTRERGDSLTLGNARASFDFLLTGELPLERGRVTVTPGAGLGITTLKADRKYLGADFQDEYDEAAGPHLRASLAGSYRFAGAWAVRLDLALGYNPMALDRLGELDGEPQDEQPLAGVPSGQAWLGLGLAYGGL